jgi:hypothetical protein
MTIKISKPTGFEIEEYPKQSVLELIDNEEYTE